MDKAEILDAFNNDSDDVVQGVTGAIDTNPDEAAEAISLGKSFNTPPAAILADPEGFKRNQKIRLATDITRNNSQISDWMMSNAMAAQLSHDDLGQLDAVSEKMGNLPRRGILAAAADGFKAGWGDESLTEEMHRFITYSDNKAYKTFAYTVWPFVAGAGAALRGTTGAMYAVGAAGGEAARAAGMSDANANRLTRDIIVGLQTSLTGQGLHRAPLAPTIAQAERAAVQAQGGRLQSLRTGDWQNQSTIKPIEPWLKEGKEPPAGISPEIDQVKVAQNEADLASLNEALGEATKSLTRERNPDMFADFIRQRTDGEIYVSADKIMEIYKDKRPTPDDGILGWVPDIDAQLQTALYTGGDIRIPVADYMAKVDPTLHKEIEGFIRTREGNITAEEVKALPPEPPKEPEFADTRGQGKRFHGTSSDLAIEEGHYSSLNYYGQGLYTTDAADIAYGYSKRGSQRTGKRNLYEIDEKAPANMFDAEAPLTPEVIEAISRGDNKGYIATAIEQGAKNLREVMDEVRDNATGDGLSADSIQEIFTVIQDNLLDAGYRGMTHKGGLRTGAKEHKVSIYFRPEEDLSARPGRYEDYYKQAQVDAIEQIREAAALRPIEDGVTLKEVKAGEVMGVPTREFSLERDGQPIGTMYIALEQQGKSVYIDNIEVAGGANTLGPRAMRGVIEQIAELFPEANLLAGERISGARAAAQKEGPAQIDLTKVRERQKPKEKPPEQLSMEDVTRIEDRALFDKASAIGMTVEQYKRYIALIDKVRLEDAQAAQKRALEDAKRRQTAEWKEAEVAMRPEVVQEVNARPDVALDRFMREGDPDNPQGPKPRVAEDLLTEEQKAAIPKEWVAARGMHPDDLATMFGYPDTATMIADVGQFVADRKQTGMRPGDYHRQLIRDEIERRMVEKYGSLSKNIIEDAMDHVLSQTQLDLLAEEVLAMGTQAGAELTIKASELRQWIAERTSESPLRMIKAEKLLADAGKAGRLAEMSLLRGDPAEAFIQKQRQFIAVSMAKEARQLEKDQARLEKLAKRFSSRDVKNVEQSATAFIQQLLVQAGYKIKLNPREIAESIQFSGYDNLDAWVNDKAGIGWEPAVAPDLFAGAKPLDQMTVAEFRDFRDAVTSLAYIGRQEFKINKLGEQIEFEQFKAEVRSNLEQLPIRPRDKQGRWLYQIDASLTRMEEIVKDLDLQQELGPLFTTVIEPMMKSKTKEFDMLQELSNHFKAVRGEFGRKWRATLKDTIPNDFLIDPYSGAPYDLTRENLIQIMLNWGNRSNIEKISKGFAYAETGKAPTKADAQVMEARIKDLIDRHAKKEDWDFVKAMWEPFKKWQKEADTVSRNVSGVVPKWIEAAAVDTPFGQIEGGYWPVKYDRLGSNITVIEDRARQGALFGPDYFRAATAKSYLKERTGYVDFVDIDSSIEQAAGVMQQTIHDIAFRDALVQAGKIFYDKEIRGLIRKHYGQEYEAQLVPWLKRIANKNTVDDASIKGYQRFFRRARINLVGHALPLNLRVILSPDVGVPNPYSWTAFEANRTANTALAMEKSNEIRHMVYNMDRDFREQLESITTKRGWDTYQRAAAQWSFWPAMKISQEFRMATFVDQYNKAKGRGLSDHEASVVADSYVRERHGAASVVDLPAIMEQGEAWKWMTMFYGYFNTMYNWQRQMPGQARRGEYGNLAVTALGTIAVGTAFNLALFTRAKKDESWFSFIARALFSQPLSTVPVLRDFTAMVLEGQEARRPDVGIMKAMSALANDARNALKGKTVNKPVSHTANVIGMTTGLPMAQPGRTSQFLYDVQRGKQKPKNMIEWMKGIIHGEVNPKR